MTITGATAASTSAAKITIHPSPKPLSLSGPSRPASTGKNPNRVTQTPPAARKRRRKREKNDNASPASSPFSESVSVQGGNAYRLCPCPPSATDVTISMTKSRRTLTGSAFCRPPRSSSISTCLPTLADSAWIGFSLPRRMSALMKRQVSASLIFISPSLMSAQT